jgi:hypothetical protein
VNAKQKKIFDEFALRRVAVFYPRRRLISLNGFPAMSVPDAVAKMSETLKRDKELEAAANRQ